MSESATTSSRSDPLPIPTGTQDQLTKALARLPFEAHLSLEPLFAELERIGADVSDIAGIEALRGVIKDPAIADEHAGAIRKLMGHVFPELMDEHVLVRGYAPFAPWSFFSTAKYREVFGAEGVQISQGNGMVNRRYYRENMLFAYRILFHTHYDVPVAPPAFVKQVRDTTSGLDRFFMNEGSIRFAQVSYPGKELLPEAEFSRLLAMENLEELERRLPLDGVTFSGFIYIRYVEISQLHNLSLLKSELVEPNALRDPERVIGRLRSILDLTDLDVGMVLHYETRGAYCNNRSLLSGYDGCMANLGGSLYERISETKEPLYFPDLGEDSTDSELISLLRAEGYRSAGLIPLLEHDHVVAILELGSKTPEAITPAMSHRIRDLITPLTVAARREMDELASQIEGTIKRHCTAIHPSVAWRFEEAAYRYIGDMQAKGSAAFEPIIFENVHPLFGAMDIRGSSANRNHAIEADLLEQLALARETLAEIHAVHPMPIAEYYDATLAKFQGSVEGGLSSGDEITVIEFLHTRIESFLNDVRKSATLPEDEHGNDAVDRYLSRMDPSLGILYRKRKQYEHSVALINNTLAACVEAQAIFPHYFEMFRTDGVEHSIYVGQSMTQERNFTEVQLKNLRLWQLTLMCKKARIAEALLAEMDIPLRTTPLVLVQSSPITIQFSADEKQFAVEGSYNIRYEIIKKRIDKSTIRGTGERLTQPGQLAVIYSQEKEFEEYRRYFEYLADKGYLDRDYEQLELDDLQGVSGLRALRATIRLDAPAA